MVSTNGITGDRLISKTNTNDYRIGWDKIFNKETHEDIRDAGLSSETRVRHTTPEPCGTVCSGEEA